MDASSPGGARLMECADVLVSSGALAPDAARRRVRELLAGHPGCLAAAVPATAAGCAVGVRARTGALSFVRLDGTDAPVPPQAVASLAHAWVVAGGSLGALRSVSLAEGR
ncbi:hypothetical protein [Streptomyces sp. NPDC058045]|uniref:hypothetical protein n=1 Tax=Streptomyces sp. NPDC058045 TaxID=3346311 RepID=UPI0036EBA2BC